MPGENLTRAEAAARSAALTVTSYAIDLDLTSTGATFESITEVAFTAHEPGGSTFLDLVAPRVREITLNGVPVDPAGAFADGRLRLDGLATANVVRVVADCAYTNTGQGLHRTIDPADGRVYHYTHFEVPDARRLYASFEQPDQKARFTFTVTAPAHWTVLSNSPTPVPDPVGDGVAVWRFAPTPPISTYITAVIAGEYHVVRTSHTTPGGQTIPMAVACRASMAAHLDADEIFEVTKQGFDYYEERFGRGYPFEKYDQIFVPEYNIGAMENVGCVTVVESHLFRSRATAGAYQARAETLLHELAHMWFGDLVTMRWWDDLWLKESFATYMSIRCQADNAAGGSATGGRRRRPGDTRYTDAWTGFCASDKAWAVQQDELPSTHPIVADIHDLDDVGVNFDGITYAKGAAVLKQLVAWVGDEAFFAGVRDYFDTYAWGNTTLTDLLGCLEKTSGRDLAEWSRQWLRTAGPNTLRPVYTLDEAGRFATFQVHQEAPAAHPTLRAHRIAIGLYRDGTRVLRHELDVAGAVTDVPELVGVARPDIVLLNDDDLTYAKIRLDEASMAALGHTVFAESLPRSLCWAAAWDMVRNAELPARTFVSLMLDGLATENDLTVIETVHGQIGVAVNRYIHPDGVVQTRARVAAAAWQRMAAEPAGSDTQLAWAKLFIRHAAGTADLDRVAALRDGTATIDGLVIDTDLRWALTAALARGGRFNGATGPATPTAGRTTGPATPTAGSAADIDAEQARDRTTSGAEYAAGVRAARPTAEAKAEAWAAVMDRDDLPNGVQYAIVGSGRNPAGLGFNQPDQAGLLAGYVEPYFASVDRIWATRQLKIARALIDFLYPSTQIIPDTVAATDAYLAASDPPPALRRLILERRSDIVRALAAREVDARA